jgi:hypothetical protein
LNSFEAINATVRRRKVAISIHSLYEVTHVTQRFLEFIAMVTIDSGHYVVMTPLSGQSLNYLVPLDQNIAEEVFAQSCGLPPSLRKLIEDLRVVIEMSSTSRLALKETHSLLMGLIVGDKHAPHPIDLATTPVLVTLVLIGSSAAKRSAKQITVHVLATLGTINRMLCHT